MLIPLASCDEAARILIDYFGPDELKNVVGGEKWWQVRGLTGIEAEWIAQTTDWTKGSNIAKERRSSQGDREMSEQELRRAAAKQHTGKRTLAKERQRHNASGAKHKSASTWKDKRLGKVVRMVRKDHASNPESSTDQKQSGADASEPPKVESAPEWEEMDLDDQQLDELEDFENLDRLKRCLYYVHGGGGFFGSLNASRRSPLRPSRATRTLGLVADDIRSFTDSPLSNNPLRAQIRRTRVRG